MRTDPGAALLTRRIQETGSAVRVAQTLAWRRIGMLTTWQQADAAGPMTELARAVFPLRRLHPSFPEVQLRQVLDQLGAAQAAGTWHGLQRPEPMLEEVP